MARIASRINKQSDQYRQNYAAMEQKLAELERMKNEALFQGEEKYINRVRKAGRMLARERIEMILDEGSPFLELCPFAGWGTDGFGTGGTVVTGIGFVSKRLCMLNSNVGTIKGGAIDYATLQKSMRIAEIAMENRLPTINMVESAGANLPDQAKIFNYGGASFREITRRSKAGIPTISIVFGSSTAGGAYIPGMSDYTIFIKNQAQVFLAGPPLVKMATNEVVDEETLGGARMHATVSGVADYMAENETDGIRIARDLMKHIGEPATFYSGNTVQEPLYDPDELLGIISADVRITFDQRELIARIVDGSDFHEFKPDYGNTLITGYARIYGYELGIIANNGVLFSEAANKGAQFIQLCNQNRTPLLFLQNITGFMVGRKYEEEGIIKHGAKMINAVSNSSVPAITIITGASYGAGNYAMCGRAYRPRFLFTYPNSKIAVMGPEQMAGVMQTIGRQAAEKAGIPYDEEQGKAVAAHMIAEAEKQSNAWYASGQVWDDGVIDPRETRRYLALCLQVIYQNPTEAAIGYGVFRM
ncbi:MAG: methylcrotonoyl-CoA carboxylase [Chitinophagales bacterium]|nr:methylcrotonoyl-CoA carboxylase [Chitinophagales bacterium]MDW8419563.1 carboxyl transferase domain-containing protein [Chitinophagales bacterium]